ELFGGYNIYREAHALRLFNFFPESMKQVLYRLAVHLPKGIKGRNYILRGTTPLKNRYIGNAKVFEENEKAPFLKSFDRRIKYQQVTKKLYECVADEPSVHKMQYIDLHTWLPGNILLKGEKMSKSHGLRLRTPFLDKSVFEVARKLPVQDKISHQTTKYI